MHKREWRDLNRRWFPEGYRTLQHAPTPIFILSATNWQTSVNIRVILTSSREIVGTFHWYLKIIDISHWRMHLCIAKPQYRIIDMKLLFALVRGNDLPNTHSSVKLKNKWTCMLCYATYTHYTWVCLRTLLLYMIQLSYNIFHTFTSLRFIFLAYVLCHFSRDHTNSLVYFIRYALSRFLFNRGPFYQHGLTLILAWISDYIHYIAAMNIL